MREIIDAAAFRDIILCADAALSENVQLINELNVFPVPDGDTGTNMSLTMNKAAEELGKRSFDSVSAAADCCASALLRGARGNSGVILSLLFRGISKRVKGLDTLNAAELAAALTDGVEAAYKAVMKPAEGTILTVSRLAAASASEMASSGAELEETMEAAIRAGQEALDNTVELNPVLKRAGVVDAGGKGFVVILTAALAALRGERVTLAASAAVEKHTAFEYFDTEDITFAFDTVFIVRKADENVELAPLRSYLATIGDSLVIGEDDSSFKVHVHTNIPGSALSEAQKYGVLELAKIENMRLQHEELLAGEKTRSTDDLDDGAEDAVAAPEKEYGVVAVCAGAGLTDVFRELGADAVVTGGQTMNPSTDDILREINRTPANTVFVFPNNKNIIMAAEQCVPLCGKKVIVIPTKSVPQGISALLSFNPDEDADSLVSSMQAAADSVHTAMVTYAARDSEFDGHKIHAGEYLALLDGALVGNYSSIRTLFKELTWAFDELEPEFINVYYGENVDENEANEAGSTLSDCFPEASVSVINGGQPVYYYMISVE